jgi:hypothetical protein
MKLHIGNSAGETSGMMTRLLQTKYGFKKKDMLIIFNNTGQEADASLDFLHQQELAWGLQYVWTEFEFPEGFEEVVMKRPATYEALEQCVNEGVGIAGMYNTELLDTVRWNDEYKEKFRKPKKKQKWEQISFYDAEYWDLIETIADYTRCMRDFYQLFGKTRGELNDRFNVVDYRSADRGGIPFLKCILYLNAVRYVKGLPYIVPNPAHRFSTGNLKVRVSDYYLASLGLKRGRDFKTCLGIRHDESDRYWNNLASDGSVWMPLWEEKITQKDVSEFWDNQPFQLAIRDRKWMGNCVDCYLKTTLRRVKACQESPVHFWRTMIIEKAVGDFMVRTMPAEKILQLAEERTVSEEDIANDTERQMSCFCG